MYAPFTKAQMTSINKQHSGHWFDKDAIRFFNSRVHGQTNKYGLFISSEQYSDGTPRMYTVRLFHPATGSVYSVSDFQQFATLAEAREYRDNLTRALNSMSAEQIENFCNITFATYNTLIGEVEITGPTRKLWLDPAGLKTPYNN